MATQHVGLRHATVAAVLVACMSVPYMAEARCISYDPALGGVRLWAAGGAYGFRLTKPAGEEPPIGSLFRLSPKGRSKRSGNALSLTFPTWCCSRLTSARSLPFERITEAAA